MLLAHPMYKPRLFLFPRENSSPCTYLTAYYYASPDCLIILVRANLSIKKIRSQGRGDTALCPKYSKQRTPCRKPLRVFTPRLTGLDCLASFKDAALFGKK